MENFSKTTSFEFRKDLDTNEISVLKSKLAGVDGIDSVDISSGAMTVEYNALILAQEGVTEVVREFGFPVSRERKKQGIFTRFIENLAPVAITTPMAVRNWIVVI